MTTNVSTWVPDESVSTVGMIRGGIKVEINGRRVNQYQKENQLDWIFDWHPEYVGEHLRSDLINFINVLSWIERGEISQYEPVKVDIEAEYAYFLLEIISESHLRLAFRTTSQENRDNHLPDTASARGFIVDTRTFSDELLNCGRDFLEQSSLLGFNKSEPTLKSFSKLLDDFEKITKT